MEALHEENVRLRSNIEDLKQQVKKGLMREDFFYRIHIIPIHLPPLRERKVDSLRRVFEISISKRLANSETNFPWN